MGLSKKTFLYSMLLAGVMVILITGYFIFMLPSLYVDYVMDSNLDSVVQVQRGYMEQRSYQELTVKNPSAVFSLEIPKEGCEMYAAGKFFRLTVTVREKELQELLDELRNCLGLQKGERQELLAALKDKGTWEKLKEIWEKIGSHFTGRDLFSQEYPLEFEREEKEQKGLYREEYGRLHKEPDGIFVYETGVSDGDYQYSMYFAAGQTEDALILTIFPAMMPQMDEILPVVTDSMPMIIAVVFLFVLAASRLFAARIVHPIIRLARHAESARLSGKFEADSFVLDSRDEIGLLGQSLKELYDRLQENYEELEQKNHALAEENERKEVFLRASSHQLKTPVTAALLLVDGMIGEVGKYSNVKEYLPEVRKQLLSMRRIVEDILFLNYQAEHMHKEKTDLRELAEEAVNGYKVQAEAGSLQFELSGEGSAVTDREMMRKILDNLFSNAVQYTPAGHKICVDISSGSLKVVNYGTTIDDCLLPHVFDPFVSSVENRRGKGLGLYVASYYSRALGCRLTLYNQRDSVCAELSFGEMEGGKEKC